MPASPTRQGFLLCTTVKGVSEKGWILTELGNSELVMMEPWKSAFKSFGCIVDELGIKSIGFETGWDGRCCNPNNSDIYPIHSLWRGKKRWNLMTNTWIKMSKVTSKGAGDYLAWLLSNLHKPISLASFLLITPSFFFCFSVLFLARFSSSCFFQRLSRAGFSSKICRPLTRVLYIAIGSDERDRFEVT